MKKQVVTMFCFLLLASISLLHGQITSNGTGGGDWNTTSTWTGEVIPTGTDNVIIVSGDSVSLAAAGSCANLTLQSGAKLALNAGGLSVPGSSWNFDVASTVYYNGTTTIGTGPTYGNLVYMSANGGPAANSTLNIAGDLTVTTATLRGISATSGDNTVNVSGNVFLTGASSRISAVNSSSATTASCTWNIGGSISLTGNNSGNRIILQESAGPHTGTTIINIDGDLTIGTNSQLQFRSSTNANSGTSAGIVNIKGNVTVNGVISTSTGGTGYNHALNLVGTSAQQWTGSFPNAMGAGQTCTVNVNNSTGVTLANAATVNTNVILALTSGKLTTTSSNLLTVSSSGSVSGGSSSSFIDGPLAITGTGSQTFPIGKGSAYRPVTLGSITGTSPVIQAEVFNAAPGGTPGSGVDLISSVRYWLLSLNSGSFTDATINLTYDSDDGVTDNTNLRVVQSSTLTGTYDDVGGTGSANTSGNITSNTISSLDYFTLANATGGSNPLPVELTSFTANARGKSVELRWNTATEVNNNGFAVERKSGSQEWAKIGFVNGAGSSNSPKAYSFTDASLASGKYLYRLKQIDNDGKFAYSQTVEVSVGAVPKTLTLNKNYPNPFNPTTNLEFAIPENGKVTLRVFNMLGQQVATVFDGVAEAGQMYVVPFNAGHLPSGIYFSVLEFSGKKLTQKMLLLK